jgi:hypothetical protein
MDVGCFGMARRVSEAPVGLNAVTLLRLVLRLLRFVLRLHLLPRLRTVRGNIPASDATTVLFVLLLAALAASVLGVSRNQQSHRQGGRGNQ